jgi:hypothetical protein
VVEHSGYTSVLVPQLHVELNQHVKKETAGKVVNVKLIRSGKYFLLLTSSFKKSKNK